MQVSALGFGTVKLGRTEGVKYPQAFTVPDDKEARALLDLSRDLASISLTPRPLTAIARSVWENC